MPKAALRLSGGTIRPSAPSTTENDVAAIANPVKTPRPMLSCNGPVAVAMMARPAM